MVIENQAVNSGVSTINSHTSAYTSILSGVFSVISAVLLFFTFVDVAAFQNRVFDGLSDALTRPSLGLLVWALLTALVYHLFRHLLSFSNSVYAFLNWMDGCTRVVSGFRCWKTPFIYCSYRRCFNVEYWFGS